MGHFEEYLPSDIATEAGGHKSKVRSFVTGRHSMVRALKTCKAILCNLGLEYHIISIKIYLLIKSCKFVEVENGYILVPVFPLQTLDGVTLQNLEVFLNWSTGTIEGTLIEQLERCHTPFGE